MRDHNYFVYILTNKNKTVLYTGVTNDLETRLDQHQNNQFNNNSFTKRYNCFYLLYYERHTFIDHAIEREKQIKGWLRSKKVALIEKDNPEWKFLNDEIKST